MPPATTALAGQVAQAADGDDALGNALGGLAQGRGEGRQGRRRRCARRGQGREGRPGERSGPRVRRPHHRRPALGKDGAANVASETKDSMAALLPQADPASVEAGAIGASPNAVVDYKAAAEQAAAAAPAQATLAMPPQSPTFAPALGQQIEVWMRDGIGHAEVQLSPQDLGPIRVQDRGRGRARRTSEMSADVAVTTRDSTLQQALPQLSDSLGQVGLSLSGQEACPTSRPAQSQGQLPGERAATAPATTPGTARAPPAATARAPTTRRHRLPAPPPPPARPQQPGAGCSTCTPDSRPVSGHATLHGSESDAGQGRVGARSRPDFDGTDLVQVQRRVTADQLPGRCQVGADPRTGLGAQVGT